jgi:hypothetical protein
VNSIRVKREEKNKDLTITFTSGTKVIIELKIKSLPNEEQLREYAIDDKDGCNNYLLFSIIKPYFIDKDNKFETNGRVWKWIDYSEFIKKLNLIKPQNDYHMNLINDYISFALSLCNLIKYFDIHSYNNGRFFVKESDREVIIQLRIHDMIDKMRYYQLAEALFNQMKKKDYKKNVFRRDWWLHDQCGDICIWQGYTNMSGLMQAGILFNKHQKDNSNIPFSVVGIQFQNNQFRLISEINKDNVSLNVANELMKENLWFDFNKSELTKNSNNFEYPKKKIFDEFTNFKYRYRKIGSDTKTEEIVNGILEFMDELWKRKDRIEQVIKDKIEGN